MSTIAQRSFAAGEVSPALYARVDQARYTTGLRQLRNTVVLRTGGTSMRPGTQFIAELRDSTYPSKLLPFISNAANAFVIELCNGYFRFYKNAAQIMSVNTFQITNISQSSPATVTVTSTGSTGTINNGLTEVVMTGIVGMTTLNGHNLKIKNMVIGQTTATFQLYYSNGTPVNSTTYPAYASGGTVQFVYEIAAPYSYANAPALQFVQSADVMTLTSRAYAPGELTRTSDQSWAINTFAAPYSGGTLVYGPVQKPPPAVAFSTTSTAASITVFFQITAVNSTKEESVPSAVSYTGPEASALTPWYLNITNITGAVGYNIYVSLNGVFGFFGTAANNSAGSVTTFIYCGTDGGAPQVSDTPPVVTYPADTYEAIGYFQQRLLLGSGTTNPAKTISSRTGNFINFSNGSSITDSDSLNFTLVGRLVQEIRHYLDLGALIILTDEGEFVVEGNTNGVVTPSAINIRQTSFIGSATLTPLVIGNSAIFVQARGSAVFDLGYDFEVRGFNGNELSIFANHLVDNYQITAWAYQKRPHSIVWAVRNDGILLSMTYVKGESIVAWARHDTLGTVEDVVCIPEGTSDAVYIIVKRQINGYTKRYLERLASNTDGDYLNSVYMDATLSFNGANSATSTVTATLTGGVNWTYDETLTITSSLVDILSFSATDVGNEVVLTGADGSVIRFVLSTIVSTTVAQGRANKTVPASLQGVATTSWAKGLKTVGGLWHLEGQKVSVLGDGFVVSSPNNADDLCLTVTNGSLTLDKPYTNIHVGLPYIADMETLDIDTTQGEPMVGKEILISTVHVHTQNTRGFWAGAQPPTSDTVNPLQNLTETKSRNQNIENMNQPASMKTDVLELNIQGNYSRGGRVFIRQVDPVPTSILAIEPAGYIPSGGTS